MSPAGVMRGKTVEVLTEVVPALERVLLVHSTGTPAAPIEAYRSAASLLEVELSTVQVSSGIEAEAVYRDVGPKQFDAVIEVTELGADALRELSRRDGIPVIATWGRGTVATMSFLVGRAEWGEQVATMVSKILRGTPPSDLPVELPRRIAFALFPDRAQAIQYEFPLEALQRADIIAGSDEEDIFADRATGP